MFTRIEIRDLAVSVLALALIFSRYNFSLLPAYIFVVIIAFFSHEMSHKFAAMHFGCDAEYRLWKYGIIAGLFMAALPIGIVIAAPGAVYVSPYKKGFAFKVATLTRKNDAIISMAGPMANISLAAVLMALSVLYPIDLLAMTAKISFFLAAFNLIPFPPFDGLKIMSWNRSVWIAMVAASVVGILL